MQIARLVPKPEPISSSFFPRSGIWRSSSAIRLAVLHRSRKSAADTFGSAHAIGSKNTPNDSTAMSNTYSGTRTAVAVGSVDAVWLSDSAPFSPRICPQIYLTQSYAKPHYPCSSPVSTLARSPEKSLRLSGPNPTAGCELRTNRLRSGSA